MFKDNGAARYANKEETRLEGPWSFGAEPNDHGGKRKGAGRKILAKEVLDMPEEELRELPMH